MLVRCFSNGIIACWIRFSEIESSDEVASSIISTRGFFEYRPGNGHALFFPAGKLDAAIADNCIIPLRETGDKIVDIGFPAGGFPAPPPSRPLLRYSRLSRIVPLNR